MKRHVVRALVLAAVVVSFSTMAWSQPASTDDPLLGQRVSFSFTQTEVAAVLKFLAQARGLEPVIDPALTQKVSFRLEHVTLRTALDALCDSAGCRWRLDGKRLVFVALPSDAPRMASSPDDEPLAPLRTLVPAGTQFTGVPLSAAFRALSVIAGPGVDLDVEGVDTSQPVNGQVGSKTVQAAIRQLVASAGLKVGSSYTIVFNRPTKKLRIIGVLTDQELE